MENAIMTARKYGEMSMIGSIFLAVNARFSGVRRAPAMPDI
jgi:hypothetical protein